MAAKTCSFSFLDTVPGEVVDGIFNPLPLLWGIEINSNVGNTLSETEKVYAEFNL